MRILVMDSHEQSRTAAVHVLREAGHEASSTDEISVAWDRLNAGEQIDLIVTGVEFPEWNACEEMPQLVKRFGVKVIATTGLNQEHHLRKSGECGFTAHLVKPIEPTELLHAVSQLGG